MISLMALCAAGRGAKGELREEEGAGPSNSSGADPQAWREAGGRGGWGAGVSSPFRSLGRRTRR